MRGNDVPAKEQAVTEAPPERLPLIDFIRGFAVLLMVAYHTAYFLDYNGLADVPLFESDFWYYSPRVIVSLFLSCSGASLYLSCRRGFRPLRYCKRIAFLSLLAGLITLGTRVVFPERFVFCGILHCAAGASVLVLPFLVPSMIRRPWIPFVAGCVIVLLSRLAILPDIPPRIDGVTSMDYIPVIPWSAAVFIGVLFGYCAGLIFQPGKKCGEKFFETSFAKVLRFLGKHSLSAYFIHITLIFGITMGIARLITG